MRVRPLLTTIIALTTALAANPGEAVTIGFAPSTQSSTPGSTFSLDLVMDGLGAGGPDSLGVFDLDVGFDPAALSLVGFTVTDLLGDVGLGEALDLSLGELFPGSVNVSVLSLLEADANNCTLCIPPFLDDIQPASFALATFDFMIESLPPGSETSVFVDSVLSLGDGFGAPLDVTSTFAGIITNQLPSNVPEPGTFALVAIAAALGGLRRARGRL